MHLKASDFGAATSRERVFFVGYRPKCLAPLGIADFLAKQVRHKTKVRAALAGLPGRISPDWLDEAQGWRKVKPLGDSAYARSIAGRVPNGVGDPEALRLYQELAWVSGCLGTQHNKTVQNRYAALRPGEKDEISKAVRLDRNSFCPTLRAGTGADRGSYQAVRPIHPTNPRVITPREAARLQGFPDWFQFAPSKWHSFRQIGNSVSPLVAEAIFTVFAEKLSLVKCLPEKPQAG